MAVLHSSEGEVVEIRRVFTERFEELLTKVAVEPPSAEALLTRLSGMRRHAIERHGYYERYCNQYLTVGLAMLPFAFTIAGFVLNFMRTAGVGVTSAIPAGLGVFAFACTGLAVLTLYSRMISTNDSYRQIEKTRSWYHNHSVVSGTGNADTMSVGQQVAGTAHMPPECRWERPTLQSYFGQPCRDNQAICGTPYIPRSSVRGGVR